jgi:hypothetical protein
LPLSSGAAECSRWWFSLRYGSTANMVRTPGVVEGAVERD